MKGEVSARQRPLNSLLEARDCRKDAPTQLLGGSGSAYDPFCCSPSRGDRKSCPDSFLLAKKCKECILETHDVYQDLAGDVEPDDEVRESDLCIFNMFSTCFQHVHLLKRQLSSVCRTDLLECEAHVHRQRLTSVLSFVFAWRPRPWKTHQVQIRPEAPDLTWRPVGMRTLSSRALPLGYNTQNSCPIVKHVKAY